MFFPTERSNLHIDELKEAYKTIEYKHQTYGDYEIFNLTNRMVSNKYNIDIFEVCYQKETLYLLKHNEMVYFISPFSLSNQNYNAVTNFAISDVNKDGNIEILTSIIMFNDKNYSTSYIQVLDTATNKTVELFDYSNVTYIKKDKDGLALYNTDGIKPISEDIVNGKLDEKYYDMATNLFDRPVINTSNYSFKERYVETSCDLFSVKISIEDNSIKAPYLFENTYTPLRFTVFVEMTYLGETFSYVSGNGYLVGATISFVNDNGMIKEDAIIAPDVVTPFTITTGMVIRNEYDYLEDLYQLNEVGTYDMVIRYSNDQNNIDESITIKDFLVLTR